MSVCQRAQSRRDTPPAHRCHSQDETGDGPTRWQFFGESKGINLALLFGVTDVKQLADPSFNKTKAIELFDCQQKMLQIEAGAYGSEP